VRVRLRVRLSPTSYHLPPNPNPTPNRSATRASPRSTSTWERRGGGSNSALPLPLPRAPAPPLPPLPRPLLALVSSPAVGGGAAETSSSRLSTARTLPSTVPSTAFLEAHAKVSWPVSELDGPPRRSTPRRCPTSARRRASGSATARACRVCVYSIHIAYIYSLCESMQSDRRA
jgi:hypothetical protein